MSDVSFSFSEQFLERAAMEFASHADVPLETVKFFFRQGHAAVKGRARKIDFSFSASVRIVKNNVFLVNIGPVKLSIVRIPRVVILKNAVRFLAPKLQEKGILLQVSGTEVVIDLKKCNLPGMVSAVRMEHRIFEARFAVDIAKIMEKIYA